MAMKQMTYEEFMNDPAQNFRVKRTLERLKFNFLAQRMSREELKQDMSTWSHEYKYFQIDVETFGVYVVMDEGLKGDDGSVASVLCRTRAHVVIGKRGGYRVLELRVGLSKGVAKKKRKLYFMGR